jgi:Mce-associated membrane protein
MTVTVTTDKKTDDDQAETADDAIGIEETAEEIVESETEEATALDLEAAAVSSRGWRRRALIGALAFVFVASLGLSGFLGWTLWQTKQVAQAGQQAEDAAVVYAQILTSIDSGKVDENFNQVLAGATGEFKDMYSQSSVQLRQLLIDNKATAHGVVVQSAVQSASKDKVVVLLFVDQSVSNSSVPDPRIDRSRIKMTMEKVDGQWRASKVELA